LSCGNPLDFLTFAPVRRQIYLQLSYVLLNSFLYFCIIKALQMYKVFVNEKKLTISKYPGDIEKKLRFEGFATLEIAVDLLENTSCPELNIYGDDIEEIWEDFTHMFKVIEAAGGIVHNSKKEILFIRRLGKW